jgi:hypothetical protein
MFSASAEFYEIENADGVRHASEVHELGLFTTGEMIDAFCSRSQRHPRNS